MFGCVLSQLKPSESYTYYSIEALLFGMKYVLRHQDLQKFSLKLNEYV